MMKKTAFLLLLLSVTSVYGQVKFDDYFTEQVLRFDFMFAGNSEETHVYPISMKQEPFFGGSQTTLDEPFDYGNFKYEVFDGKSGKLLYSRGFCTLFQEWQTTAEAKQMDRSFYEVATMPFPKGDVLFVISERERSGSFTRIYETEIKPTDYFIRKETPVKAASSRIMGSGEPESSVDIVILAEGYVADEMPKFRADAMRMAEVLLSAEPFSEYKSKFNVWIVEAISQESGTDIPGHGTYRNTVLNSSFYTFDTERYLTTLDIKSVNDYAGLVPHDNIIILVNTDKYGGGGVYNYYSITAADNDYSNRVFVHELGHSFAGLADEYFNSQVAYEEFYPLNVEPWEPNITTLVRFDLKWKDMLDKKTPIPTPVDVNHANTLGVFEGGGYSAKGIYRPRYDCTMKSNTNEGFCPVCKRAIVEMIKFYSGK